jgi:malonyl-CoA O-methyltransferase
MPSPNTLITLNRNAIVRAFSRAAARYAEHAFLQREVESRLLDRLHALAPKAQRILDLGAGDGHGTVKLRKLYPKADIIALDLSAAMCAATAKKASWWRPHRVVRGDFSSLPFAAGSFDLIYSSLALQWAPALDGVIAQLRLALRADGLLLFTTLGPDTLIELRSAWAQVDQAPHVHVFLDQHDIGDALLRAGLKDPVMDMERITLTYSDARKLMRDIKGIGAHNANTQRERGLTGKARFNAMLAAYERFRRDGVLPATYEVIYAHALGAAPGQPVREGENAVARIPIGAIGRIKR